MAEVIVIAAILTAAFTISSISYKLGRLDGYHKAQNDFLKLLDDVERKRKLAMLAGRKEARFPKEASK